MWIAGGRTMVLAVACVLAASCGGNENKPVDQFGDIGDACNNRTDCQSGLVCAHDGTCQDPGTPGENGDAAEGEACTQTDDCGYGLVCGPDDECIPSGVAEEWEGCGSTEDCQYGLVCSSGYVCVAPGDGGPGAACDGAEDCNEDLVCASDGTCQDPETGTGVGGVGDTCTSTDDCMTGLFCFGLGATESVCTAPEIWSGADCTQSDEEEEDPAYPFKAYFEIPRGTTVVDFYRLPFPNNIRFRGGVVDLGGHPQPDTPLASGLVSSYLDAIENEAEGFSVQGAVFFRFSKRVDFDTVSLSGDSRNFFLVDITPSSPGYGGGGAYGMYATTSRGKYICQNWMAIKPSDGYPLRHATTYAVILTDGVHAGSGSALVRDDDFDLMLEDTAPTDATLAAAWDEYQPLRDYLADTTLDPPVVPIDSVMAAAVFTTMDPDSLMASFRDKVRACTGSDCDRLPDPAPVGTTLESDETLYYVVTGNASVPVFQAGEPPYVTEGGIVEFNSSGVPTIQRSEPVSFTLSVPKGTPPAEGWPVVVYGHGTGGSSRSFVDEGVAEALSEVEVTIGSVPATVKFAVLSIDGVQHGTRRGTSDLSPDVLYFNFLNPEAAKYNAVQGAADNFQLVRMIESLRTLPVTVSGIPDPIQLDPLSISYFGHSQGSLTGPLFVAYDPDVDSVVLSGAGGNLIQSLLTKTMPIDIAGATRLMLGDPFVGAMHPMLSLLQTYFDPIDVVNYGRDLTYSPVQIGETTDDPPLPIYAGPKNVFMSFGRDDHYSTESTMASFVRPMALQQVNDIGLTCACGDVTCDDVGTGGLHTDLCRLGGIGEATSPVRGNGIFDGTRFTAVMKMYLADGYDGHFVLFNDPEGPTDYSLFLASTVADPEGIPTFFP